MDNSKENPDKPPFKVGDVVKCLCASSCGIYAEGKTYEVLGIRWASYGVWRIKTENPVSLDNEWGAYNFELNMNCPKCKDTGDMGIFMVVKCNQCDG